MSWPVSIKNVITYVKSFAIIICICGRDDLDCLIWAYSGPEIIKKFPCSTQLSTNFILLINVKMPTIVGILTFISLINTTSERLKARNFFICRYFSFYEQLKFHAQLIWAWTKFYNLGAWWLIFAAIWEYGEGNRSSAQDSDWGARGRLLPIENDGREDSEPDGGRSFSLQRWWWVSLFGPRPDKTCLRGFWETETQTGLLSFRD